MAFVAVHRYYNDNTGDHFYTTNVEEIGTTKHGVTGKNGYVSEGDAFFVASVQYPGLVPIYRYWNSNAHDHFYTTNAAEIGTTSPGQAGNNGYVSEGVLGFISPHQIHGSVAVYRYWNSAKADHFYTTSDTEIGTTTQGQTGALGYVSEGILGFAWSAFGSGILHPVYRYWNAATGDHFYTTNGTEIGTTQQGATGNNGYVSEGVGYEIFSYPLPGLVPVYRYWQPGSHDHFYTTNAAEIGTTTQGQAGNNGYVSEGILGYLSPNHYSGSVAVYRYWSPSHSDHFYTTNAGEIGTTTQGQEGKNGYISEGILGYTHA